MQGDLKSLFEDEFFERERIRIVEDLIIDSVNLQKKEYFENLDKHYQEHMKSINSNDDQLEEAIKARNVEELKKAFQKLLE